MRFSCVLCFFCLKTFIYGSAGEHSLFIKNDGSLWGMGYNTSGQLGIGNTTNQLSPVEILSSGVQFVVTGDVQSLILKNDGTLWGMGNNGSGQLGDGTSTNRTTPVLIRSGVRFVTSYSQFTHFIDNNNSLWAMGSNSSGRLGDETSTNRTTPVLIDTNVSQVANGWNLSYYLKQDGTVWAAGANNYGQFGDSNTSSSLTPRQIYVGHSNIKKIISAGYNVLVLKNDGSLWGSGRNHHGQLGTGNTTQQNSPLEILSEEVSDVVASGGTSSSQTFVIKSDGSLWGMGHNGYGQLGDANTSNKTSPTQIFSSGVVQVATGYDHTYILKNDGSLWTMGRNKYGQLGSNSTTSQTTPTLLLDSNVTRLANVFSNITFSSPPVISQGNLAITKTLNEDAAATWTPSELNATDSDTNAAQLSWSLLSSPSYGTVIVDGNGSSPQVFTYQPDANFHGSDSFSVQVSDGDANDSITINLTINPVDDPSVISGDSSGILNEDYSFTGDLNATDLDGLTDGSYFSISSVPTNGVATIDTLNGNWTYTPDSNFFGSDNFTIMITDDQGYSSTQLIFLIVNPVDDTTSISGNTNAAISEDSNAIGDLNATDVDGLTDGSYFSVSSDPSIGTASIDVMEGNWTYIPTPNFFGEDSFTITITDDQGNTATQEISVTINSVDDATLISGDTHATINEDSFASGDLNASDIDGLFDGSYFSISTIPSSGSASIDPLTGRWSYSPNPNFFGTDVFTVTITDDLNFTATQEISVTINTVDDPTTITGDTSGLLFLNHSVGGDINATDIDGLNDSSYFSIHSAPTFGSATVDHTSGSWSYNPQTGFLGDDSFVIQITDDQGYTTNQTISLIPQYNVPVAQTDATNLSTENKPIFSGSILYDGGLPILEVGFYTSSSSQFTTSTKLPVSLANGSYTFTLELNQTELTSTIFVRAYARNQNGETLGEIKRLDPAPIIMQWSSHATVLDNGWMQSDWFGTFTHFPQNWIFHSRLGWLYIPDSTTEELWLWAPDHGWLWTGKDVFPHLYKNSTGTWLYLLDQEVKGKNIYDYQSGLFE